MKKERLILYDSQKETYRPLLSFNRRTGKVVRSDGTITSVSEDDDVLTVITYSAKSLGRVARRLELFGGSRRSSEFITAFARYRRNPHMPQINEDSQFE